MTQKSESLQIMFILTLIGGFLDSYSYVTRGGVFAFAQTGNLVLLSINICYGNLDKIVRYVMLLISFVCAMQIEAFRRFNGVDLMTTMCTGNLKKATDRLIDYFYTKDNNLLKASFTTYSAILIFIIGCIIGTLTSFVYSTKSIFILPVVILIAFIIMHETERNK